MKKILTLISAFCLGISVLAGCGTRLGAISGGDSDVYSLDSESTFTSQGGNDEEVTSFYDSDPFKAAAGNTKNFKETIKNLKGRNIIIAGMNKPGDTSVSGKSLAETEQRYNCTFEFRPMSRNDVASKLQTAALAGKPDFDAGVLWGIDFLPRLINMGAVYPITDGYNIQNDPTWTNDYVKDLGWWMGKRYAIPTGPSFQGYAYWYNKELLIKNNLKDPWTYVENNTWNFANFKSLCQKVTKRMGANSSDSTYGWCCEAYYSSMIVANGGNLIDMVDGKYQVAIDSPKAIEAINFVIDLMTVSKVIPSTQELLALGCRTDNPVYEGVSRGKVLFFPYTMGYCGEMKRSGASEASPVAKEGIEAKYIGCVYAPKGPSTKSYRIQSLTQPDMLMIARGADKPGDVALALQDYIGYWRTTKASYVTIGNAFENYKNGGNRDIYGSTATDPNLFKLLTECGKITVYTNEMNLDMTGEFNNVFNEIKEGVADIKLVMQIQKNALQKKLNEKLAMNN